MRDWIVFFGARVASERWKAETLHRFRELLDLPRPVSNDHQLGIRSICPPELIEMLYERVVVYKLASKLPRTTSNERAANDDIADFVPRRVAFPVFGLIRVPVPLVRPRTNDSDETCKVSDLLCVECVLEVEPESPSFLIETVELERE